MTELLKRILATAAAAGWIVSPVDLIPDLIPLFGQMDDVAIAALLVVYWVRYFRRKKAAAGVPGPR